MMMVLYQSDLNRPVSQILQRSNMYIVKYAGHQLDGKGEFVLLLKHSFSLLSAC